MQRPGWVPDSVDVDRPSTSRMYDYFLGGSHNFAADRRVATEALQHMPELPMVLRANRAFLRRAVRYLVQAGMTQFLDLGSGIPTAGNVHEIAQRADPGARVVYVDIDPVAVAHSRAILAGNDNATAVQADLRQPEQLLTDRELTRVLDLSRPVAVLLVAVLHFLPDSEDPGGIIARLRPALAPGSYLVISHASADGAAPTGMDPAREVYARSNNPIIMRSRAQIEALFAGFELVEPGLVRLPRWRPDDAGGEPDSEPDSEPGGEPDSEPDSEPGGAGWPSDPAGDGDPDRFPGFAGVGRRIP